MKKLKEEFGIQLFWSWSVTIVVALLILGGLFRGIFLSFVDSYEIGYQFNYQTGKTNVLPRTGYFFVVPFKTVVHSIDGRPMQVRIEANNRVLNAKLVRFRRSDEGVLQFVQMHGRQDYDQTQLAPILMSYAYENYGGSQNDKMLEKKYKFLEIMLSSGVNASNTTEPQLPTTDSIPKKP